MRFDPVRRLALRLLGPVGGRRAMLIALGLEVLVLLYVLRPLLWSSYSGDDVIASQGPMWRELTGNTLWDDISRDFRTWTDTNGRLFPVTVVHYTVVFAVFTDRLSYKIVQLVTILLAWVAFVGFVRVATRSWNWAAQAGAVSLFAFQFRNFHDPLLQFWGQHPFVVALSFTSLTAFVLAGRAPTEPAFRRWAVTGTVLWVVGMLTYETLYPLVLVPIAVLTLVLERRRRRIGMWVIGAPTAVLLGVIVWLRSLVTTDSPAYTLGLDSWQVIPTFLEQVTSVFPLSYQLLVEETGTPRLTSGWSPLGLSDLLVLPVLVAIAVLLIGWCRPAPIERRMRRVLGFAAALIVVVPSAIIAVTRQWQVSVVWGKPYVSIFFSSIGFALLLLVAFDVWRERLATREPSRWRGPVIRASIGAAVAVLLVGPMIIADTNAWVVDRYSSLRTDREAFRAEIEGGVFDRVEPGSIVIADEASTWFWVNGAFVNWYGGPTHLRFIRPDDPRISECETAQCYRYVPGPEPIVIPLVPNA